MSPRDPRWVGAWWLGFVLFGALSIIVAIPLFFFPRTLVKETQQEKEVFEEPEEKSKTLFDLIKGQSTLSCFDLWYILG